ncbi:MAG: hypothetical protein BWK76_25930 [Desulfobulbaceae bacterium A2]|nr:MAG: hypothetical protein BWK76_25930 [Desulfobulbaceae bacterium A2]
MTMQRRIVLLALLLAAQLLAVALLYWPERQQKITGALLLDLRGEEVTEMRLRDNEGREVVLRRLEQGWQLNPALEGQAADEVRVQALLERLTALRGERLVSRTPGSHARLKVAKELYNRRVELVGRSGTLGTLYLGTGQGQSGVHVRGQQTDEVYFAAELSLFEVAIEPQSWQKPAPPPQLPPQAEATTDTPPSSPASR